MDHQVILTIVAIVVYLGLVALALWWNRGRPGRPGDPPDSGSG